MPAKAVNSVTSGHDDPAKVAVALLDAVRAAESGHRTLRFLGDEPASAFSY